MSDFRLPIFPTRTRILPKMIESPLCQEVVGPKRKHKKKRIQKKYIKLYGMEYKSTAYLDKINNIIFIHPEYKKALEDSLDRQKAEHALYRHQMNIFNSMLGCFHEFN